MAAFFLDLAWRPFSAFYYLKEKSWEKKIWWAALG